MAEELAPRTVTIVACPWYGVLLLLLVAALGCRDCVVFPERVWYWAFRFRDLGGYPEQRPLIAGFAAFVACLPMVWLPYTAFVLRAFMLWVPWRRFVLVLERDGVAVRRGRHQERVPWEEVNAMTAEDGALRILTHGGRSLSVPLLILGGARVRPGLPVFADGPAVASLASAYLEAARQGWDVSLRAPPECRIRVSWAWPRWPGFALAGAGLLLIVPLPVSLYPPAQVMPDLVWVAVGLGMAMVAAAALYAHLRRSQARYLGSEVSADAQGVTIGTGETSRRLVWSQVRGLRSGILGVTLDLEDGTALIPTGGAELSANVALVELVARLRATDCLRALRDRGAA